MESQNVTLLLQQARAGNSEAVGALFNAVYGSLRSIARKYMRHEREGHMLQATALVNEAYIRLFGNTPIAAEDRTHFFEAAAGAMRRILIDQARNARALKRNGGARVTLHEWMSVLDLDLDNRLDLEAALQRLGQLDARQRKIIDLLVHAGRTTAEIAELLQVSKRTVEREVRSAGAFLRWELRRGRIDARAVAKN